MANIGDKKRVIQVPEPVRVPDHMPEKEEPNAPVPDREDEKEPVPA